MSRSATGEFRFVFATGQQLGHRALEVLEVCMSQTAVHTNVVQNYCWRWPVASEF